MFPGSEPHILFTNLNFVGLFVPGSTSTTFTFFGSTPPTVTNAPALILVPVTSRKNVPFDCRSILQFVIVAISGVLHPGVPGVHGGGVPGALHLNVTWIPCSFPNGHPAGAPAGSVVRFLLVPPGPVTKIRNVFPAFALPNVKCASIRFGASTWNVLAWITFAGFEMSCANTLVTACVITVVAPPVPNGPDCSHVKHAPASSRSSSST